MMKFLKLTILTLILLFFFSEVRGDEDITIEIMIKDSFRTTETVTFDYSIISEVSTEITFLPYVDCPDAPVKLLKQEVVKLQASRIFTDTYSSITIDESIEPQICTAYVEILEPIHQGVKKEFKIVTKPSFDIQILSCKDENCTEKSKVFVRGEKAYFDYSSEVSETEVKGKLTAPDNSVRDVVLPANLVFNQVGKYILKTEAKKEGYKTNIQTLEIVVLAESPKVIDIRICNANGVCEADRGENYQNCPQDCLSPEALEIKKSVEEEVAAGAAAAAAKRKIYYILAGIGIFIALGVATYFYLRKKWLSWPK